MKEFFGNIKNRIMLILTGLSAILGFIVYWKFKKDDGTRIDIDLATTQKKLDLIQADISERKESAALKKGQIKELEVVQKQLDDKRQELDKQNLTEKQITDHWNQ